MATLETLVGHVQVSHLEPGEKVLASVMGAYEAKVLGSGTVRQGVFVATDRRLIFYGKKMFGYDLETFPYTNISSVEMSTGFMGATISLYASGNKVRMKWIAQGNVRAFVDVVNAHIGRSSAPQGATPSLTSDDLLGQLERLAQLRSAGVLNEEEFAVAKARVLTGGTDNAVSPHTAERAEARERPVPDEVIRHLQGGSFVQAVAAYHRLSGLSLSESTEYVKSIADLYNSRT